MSDTPPVRELQASAVAALLDHPYAAEIEAERAGWYELLALIRSLTPAE